MVPQPVRKENCRIHWHFGMYLILMFNEREMRVMSLIVTVCVVVGGAFHDSGGVYKQQPHCVLHRIRCGWC